jgi:hypothetical protein
MSDLYLTKLKEKLPVFVNTKGIGKVLQCDICGIKKIFRDNRLFRCRFCRGTAHQTCYGGPLWHTDPLLLPSFINWHCQRCEEYKVDKKLHKCFICNRYNGILRRVNDELFAHLDCIGWNPFVEFRLDVDW